MNRRVSVKKIYDPGTAVYLEDRYIVSPTFYGVLDGVSEPYAPGEGPLLFDGASGGSKVVDMASAIVEQEAGSHLALSELLIRANRVVGEYMVSKGLALNHPERLPGTMFAMAKVGGENIEIVQGGDCFAAWRGRDGKVSATPNQAYWNETELVELLKASLARNADQNAAWKEYLPKRGKIIRERINRKVEKGYAVLNGQPGFSRCWQTFSVPREEMDVLLLFTDGMVELEETQNPQKMAEMIIEVYCHSGLAGMLERIRNIERNRKEKSHIEHVEAAAVALEF